MKKIYFFMIIITALFPTIGETITYDRIAAVNYAAQWWNGTNTAVYGDRYPGNDCANFVSQCLIAGGLLNQTYPAVTDLANIISNFSAKTSIQATNPKPAYPPRYDYNLVPASFGIGDVAIFGNNAHAVIGIDGGRANTLFAAHSTDLFKSTTVYVGKPPVPVIVNIDIDYYFKQQDNVTLYQIDTTLPKITNINVNPDPANINPNISAIATDLTTNITAAEYYIDSPDPGKGLGTGLVAKDGSFDQLTEEIQGTINISGLLEGLHTVYVRAKDFAGNWSSDTSYTFTKFGNPYIKAMTINPLSANSGDTVTVTLQFSKTMQTIGQPTVTYGLTAPYNQNTITGGVWSKTVYDNDTWIGATTAPALGGQYFISVSAQDLAYTAKCNKTI